MSLAPQLIVAISKFDGAGEKNIVAGAEIIITRRAGGAQNIYSDEAGTSLITQPAYTDANGERKFFIADGAYTYTIAGQSYSVDVNSSQTATFSTVTASQLIGFHYGNGYNLTNLRADMIDSGILNELRLPSIINSSKTFQNGDFLVKPASGITQLSLTTAGSYMNAPSGSPAFGSTDSLTSVSFGGNNVIQASSTFSKIRFNSTDVVTADTSATKVKFNSADILVASSGQTGLFREGSTTPAILAGASSVQLFSPAAPVISATSTTTTINAGNGASSISIDNAGGVSLSSTLRIPTNTKINFGTGVAGFNHTNTGTLRLYSNIINYNELATYDLSGDYQGSLISSDLLIGIANQTGLLKLYVNSAGDTVAGGSMTAANFYGNGYNLTQLNASEVKNGLLPSNIFPSTISAATITFSGNHIAKGGTAYNLLDITSTASILRDSAGNDVFNSSTTALALKRANNIVLNATSTATQLFNHAGSIRTNFDASTTQFFSPANVPFISATTTTATITSGNGATCLTIDSTGAGLMRFPVYTVSTVPSASANADRVIIVSNASLGRGLYTSDGTNWRSAQSGTILS
jgi:hypothetical protein